MLTDGGKCLTRAGISEDLDPAFEETESRTESQGQETAVGSGRVLEGEEGLNRTLNLWEVSE